MNKLRPLLLLLLLGIGVSLIYILHKNKTTTPLHSSLAPIFQLFGKSTKSIDRALSKVIPINEIDEKEYGNAIAISYNSAKDSTDKDFIYLNKIIKNLSKFSKKPFTYRVFLVEFDAPNAFALPGGIICVTKGLMQTMKTEAEIVSVLAHEMGHIERGHCFEAIKYELLFKKIKSPTVGQLADFTINLFLRHSFSKTQENDADEYGYDLLLLTQYDPSGFGGAFNELYKYEVDSMKISQNKNADLLRDYFMSHPPLPLRIEKFSEKAKIWWDNHNSEKRYVGKTNLQYKVCFYDKPYSSEWIKM
jgi:predicted Zn-dependent protease